MPPQKQKVGTMTMRAMLTRVTHGSIEGATIILHLLQESSSSMVTMGLATPILVFVWCLLISYKKREKSKEISYCFLLFIDKVVYLKRIDRFLFVISCQKKDH